MGSIEQLIKAVFSRGQSLQEVANATGVSKPYLAQLKNGECNNPSFSVVEKLANYVDWRVVFERKTT